MIETCKMSKAKEHRDEVVMLKEDNVKPNLGVDEKCCSELWYLDTGASNHMTSCVDVFTNMDTSVMGSVKFGDGSVGEIHGRGLVLLKGLSGEHKVLSGVYCILCLRGNIASLGQLDESGCKTGLKDCSLSIYDQEKNSLSIVKKS